MIRVVADTNVYVSAIVFRGTCEAILALARAGVLDLYVSPARRRSTITRHPGMTSNSAASDAELPA